MAERRQAAGRGKEVMHWYQRGKEQGCRAEKRKVERTQGEGKTSTQEAGNTPISKRKERSRGEQKEQ